MSFSRSLFDKLEIPEANISPHYFITHQKSLDSSTRTDNSRAFKRQKAFFTFRILTFPNSNPIQQCHYIVRAKWDNAIFSGFPVFFAAGDGERMPLEISVSLSPSLRLVSRGERHGRAFSQWGCSSLFSFQSSLSLSLSLSLGGSFSQ